MRAPRRSGCGFTLVEVLVALAVMALMSAMAWRGVDAMLGAQEQTRRFSADVLTLQIAMSQWGRDLDSVTQVPPVGGLDFDGRVLRITRWYGGVAAGVVEEAIPLNDAGHVRVVAWGARMIDGQRQFLRWQSGPLRTGLALRQAWDDAAAWGQNPTEELRRAETVVAAIDEWQIFYFRNNAWSSPLSSAAAAGAAFAAGQTVLPDGVRLVLNLSSGQSVDGRLTRDWVKPTLVAGSP